MFYVVQTDQLWDCEAFTIEGLTLMSR